jgi:hypothetical protein
VNKAVTIDLAHAAFADVTANVRVTTAGVQTNNGRLIFHCHDVAREPGRDGCTPAFTAHAREAAFRRQIPVSNRAEALLCAGA